MKNPCYNTMTKTDCSRRCVGCSSNCEEWSKYVKQRDEFYEKRKKTNDDNSIYFDSLDAKRKKKHLKRR